MRIVIHACSLFLRFQTCKINVLKWHKGKCLVEAGHFCFSCCFSRVEERRKKVVQSCPTLCDPMDCSLLGSSIHGIFQARILEWVAVSFSRGSSRPRDWTRVSRIVGRRFTIWATKEVLSNKVTFDRRPEGNGRESHVDIWGEYFGKKKWNI